jgi:hypothetical protein
MPANARSSSFNAGYNAAIEDVGSFLRDAANRVEVQHPDDPDRSATLRRAREQIQTMKKARAR